MPLAGQGAPPSLRGTGFAYLAVLFVGDVAAQVVNQIVPEDAASGALSPALLLSIATLASSAVLWFRYRGGFSASPGLRVFLGALLGLWLLAFLLTATRREQVSVMYFAPLFLLAGLWLRPPTEYGALRTADALGWALIASTVVTVALEATGVVPSWYERSDLGGLAESDRSFYWLPLREVLGLDGRWAGPFVHPNLAGPLGAALLVFGLGRAGVTRAAFAVVGTGVLLLTGSRNSLVAAAVGVLVLVISWWLRRAGRLPVPLRVTFAAVPVVALLAALYLRDPGFSGRTTVWPEFLRLWGDDRVLGVGQGGIDALIDDGVLPVWAHHAHNVALDTLVRYGIVGLLLMVVVVASAVLIAWRRARSGRATGLALVATLLAGSLADTILHWQYLTTPMAVLVLAVLMSSGIGERPTRPDPDPESTSRVSSEGTA